MKPLFAQLAAVALIGAVVTLEAISIASSEPDSAFVEGGAGVESLVEDARLQGLAVERLVAGPLGLAHNAVLDPSRTLLVVAAVPRAYSTEEAEAAAGFVARGGRILVADDFGQANSLLVPMGMAFERVRLVEPNPEGIVATVDGQRFALLLQGPTALKLPAAGAAHVMAWSSDGSFLDRDGDGIIGPADPRGPFPVAAQVTPHGSTGSVLAVADVGFLSAAGADQKQNRLWRQAMLLQALPDGGLVLIDESQVVSDPILRGLGAAVAAAAAPPWRYVLMGAAALMLAALAFPAVRDRWLPHRFRPHRFVRRSSLADPNNAPGAPAPGTFTGASGAPEDNPSRRASQWTPRGVAAILAVGALSASALLFGSREAGYAAGAMMVALSTAGLSRLPRVEASRTVSVDRTDEGSDLQVSLQVLQRSGRRADLQFRDQLPDEFELRTGTNWFTTRLARRQPLTVSYVVSPALRGPYALGPLQIRLEDPLGLHIQEDHVGTDTPIRVNPRKESVRQVPFRTRVPTITLGPHLVNRAGDGSEFHALRTYQLGDSYRSVNWKASARSKELMVNQRVHESMARVTIFLDARAISGAGPASQTPLAQACRAALSVASGALRMRDRIRIVVYGDGVYELPPTAGSRQILALTELLSELPAAGATPFLEAVQHVLPTLQGGSPAMLASGLEADPSIVDGMRQLRSRGLLPFVVAVPLGIQPVEPDDDTPEPGAQELADARAQTIAKLQSLGIPVFDAAHDVPLDYLFRTGGGV